MRLHRQHSKGFVGGGYNCVTDGAWTLNYTHTTSYKEENKKYTHIYPYPHTHKPHAESFSNPQAHINGTAVIYTILYPPLGDTTCQDNTPTHPHPHPHPFPHLFLHLSKQQNQLGKQVYTDPSPLLANRSLPGQCCKSIRAFIDIESDIPKSTKLFIGQLSTPPYIYMSVCKYPPPPHTPTPTHTCVLSSQPPEGSTVTSAGTHCTTVGVSPACSC